MREGVGERERGREKEKDEREMERMRGKQEGQRKREWAGRTSHSLDAADCNKRVFKEQAS